MAKHRQVSMSAARAFATRKEFTRRGTGSTQVGVNPFTKSIEFVLHDNTIAVWDIREKEFWTSLCGYGTQVTRERLNCLLEEMYIRGYIEERTWIYQKGRLQHMVTKSGGDVIIEPRGRQYHELTKVGKEVTLCI